VQYIVLGAAVLILGINVIVGMSRGLKRGLLRLVLIAVAAVAAFFVAGALSDAVGAALVPKIQELLSSNPDLSSFFGENPEMLESVDAVAQMLVGPILLLLCYMVLKLITWLIYFILCKLLHIKKEGALIRTTCGAALGLVIGVVGLVAFVTPVMGYTQLLSRTLSEADAVTARMGEMELEEYNEQYLAPAATAPIAAQAYDLLGSKLFCHLSSAEWNGETVELENEWFAVVGAVNSGIRLTEKPLAEYGETESQSIHAMIGSVEHSVLLSGIGSDAISTIAGAWLQGDTFMSVAKPAVGDESVEIILDGLLKVLATTDSESFGSDLDFFADLIDLMIEYGILEKINSVEQTDDLVAYLVTSGFLDETQQLLQANTRMRPVNEAISNAAMRLLVKQLGDPAKYLEEHGELMDAISGALKGAVDNEGNVNVEALAENVNNVLAEHQVDIPEAATEIIADALKEEFTGEELTSLSVPEITDRLIAHLGDLPNIGQYIDEAA